jgi:inhibitor of cysteine peptidase
VIPSAVTRKMGPNTKVEMSALTLTQSDKDSSLEVRQGDVITVRLPENPTTGYRWAIKEMDEEIIEPARESSDFALSPDAGIGGGGERRLDFRVKKAGVAHVQLELARSWEEGSAIDRYGFTIQVR